MSKIIGKNSYSFTNFGENVIVGNYTSIAQGVVFFETYDQHLCHNNHKCVYTINWNQNSHFVKPIEIGHDVWIGREAMIFNGVKIGNGAIIGARAVITKDVPPFAVVVGNPAKIIRFRFTPEQILKLDRIGWWHWELADIQKNQEDFYDIDLFIQKHYRKEIYEKSDGV